MKLSVIIATYNRRDLLARTLPRLLAQEFPADQYEIVIVVDGSTDGTAEFLRTFSQRGNLRVIEQANRGQAAAINTGLRESRGNIVLFMDDDIVCGANVVAEHANAPRSDSSCMAFGPVLVAPEGCDALALDWARTYCDNFFRTKVHETRERGWYGCMASANSSLPRNVALATGGLDDSFSRGNDVEFGFRLLKAGYRFNYLPSAVTHQIFNKTRRDVIEDASGEGSAEVRLGRKFPELRGSSRFALLSAKPWWKRTAACTVAIAPVSAGGIVAPFTWLFGRLGARRTALRLLQMQQNIAAYRSAVRETGSWDALMRQYGVRLPILMYHCIGPLREGFDEFLTIPAKMFEQHLRWLKRNGYTPIHVADWVAYLREGKPLPTKPVLLTFDDGYRDTAEFGLPLLQKYGFKGTLFVVSDYIGKTNSWDRHLNVSELPLMTAEEVRYWAANGIEIGSHSRCHPDLRTISDAEIQSEMNESRRVLEQITGIPVTCFAYPYGYFDQRASEAARGIYEAALTCDVGMNGLSTDPMMLKRGIIVPRFTPAQMFFATHLGYNLLLTTKIQASLQIKQVFRRLFRIDAS